MEDCLYTIKNKDLKCHHANIVVETRMSHMMQILKTNKSEEDKEKWLNHMISQYIRQKKNGI
jgi:hypothetical protein